MRTINASQSEVAGLFVTFGGSYLLNFVNRVFSPDGTPSTTTYLGIGSSSGRGSTGGSLSFEVEVKEPSWHLPGMRRENFQQAQQLYPEIVGPAVGRNSG